MADHREIAIVARDRGGGYGEAVVKALPHAMQVADRWHLIENASRAFLDAVRKSMRQIRSAIGATTIHSDLLTCAERIHGALARVVMIAAKEPDTEDGTAGRRILARAKSNIGPDEGGFAYCLELVPMPGRDDIEASVAVWGERIDGTARDMLAVAESSDDDGGATAFNEAKDFLLDFLMDGPKPAKVVQSGARDAGHTWATIRRAKDALDVVSTKSSGDGAWKWALPQGAQQKSRCSHLETMSALSTFKEKQRVRAEHDAQGAHRFKVEHLGQDDNGGTPIDGWEGEI